MNEHITKPIDPDVLYRTLTKYLTVCTNPFSMPSDDSASEQDQHATPIEDIEDENFMIDRLEQIPELEARQALAKMNGRTPLYLGLVRDFSQQQQKLSAQMTEMFEQQQWSELHRTAHSLKSNAAYIGASSVSKLAEQLEDALAQNKYDQDTLNKLCQQLSPLIEHLSQVYPQNNDGAYVVEQTSFSLEELISQLAQVIPLLQASSFEVEDILPDMAVLCEETEHHQQILDLIEMVDDLEYEKAAKQAAQWLTELSAN